LPRLGRRFRQVLNLLGVDEAVFEKVVLPDAMRGVIGPIRVLQQYPRLQAWSVVLHVGKRFDDGLRMLAETQTSEVRMVGSVVI